MITRGLGLKTRRITKLFKKVDIDNLAVCSVCGGVVDLSISRVGEDGCAVCRAVKGIGKRVARLESEVK